MSRGPSKQNNVIHVDFGVRANDASPASHVKPPQEETAARTRRRSGRHEPEHPVTPPPVEVSKQPVSGLQGAEREQGQQREVERDTQLRAAAFEPQPFLDPATSSTSKTPNQTGDRSGAGTSAARPEEAPNDVADLPAASLYRRREVAKLFALTEGRLRYWQKTGLVEPSENRDGVAFYTFQDLVGVRTVKELLEKGVSAQRVRALVDKLRREIPELRRPLTKMRVFTEGGDLLVRDRIGSFDASSGQRLLDFAVDDLQEEVVTEIRPELPGESRERASAYAHYLEGCRLDEEEATWRQAEEAYKQAIELDPSLSNAFTNLGNLRYRQRRLREAEELYHRALAVEHGQPEALYNLGFLQFERGAFEDAARSFEEALASEPAFADAHFNLAMVQEELGHLAAAKPHWEAYLELEPRGPWAEVARRHYESAPS